MAIFQISASDALIDTINQRLRDAYHAGWQDARAAILSAAALPPGPPAEPQTGMSDNLQFRQRAGRRAPKGLLTSVLTKVIADHPGSTVQELERLMPSYDDRVSPKSVGNELRRGEGERYVRDGTLWYLPSHPEGEAVSNQIHESEF